MARVLVVDDDPHVRELLTAVISEGGHAVKAVPNGTDALEKLAVEAFEVVVMDRSMPRLSGIEVLVAIRKDPALKGVKVIMCTGAGMVADVDDALSAGADDYVVKPLDIPRLLEKVAKHAAAAVPRVVPASGGVLGAFNRLFRPQS